VRILYHAPRNFHLTQLWDAILFNVGHSNARGNLVTDAHLAALAIEHGTGICSFDGDFARFKGLRWINPSHEES